MKNLDLVRWGPYTLKDLGGLLDAIGEAGLMDRQWLTLPNPDEPFFSALQTITIPKETLTYFRAQWAACLGALAMLAGVTPDRVNGRVIQELLWEHANRIAGDEGVQALRRKKLEDEVARLRVEVARMKADRA